MLGRRLSKYARVRSQVSSDNSTEAQLAYLFATPWKHEFVSFDSGRVPSHRLFYAHELSRLGLAVQYYDQVPRTCTRFAVLKWRICQGVWSLAPTHDAIVATHESASYPSLFLRRLGVLRRPVVVLTVAAEAATEPPSPLAKVRRWLLGAADLLVVYSSDQMETLSRRFPRARISFVPLGVDTNFFAPDPSKVRGESLLAVGTNPGKDYATLVQALPSDRALTIVTDRHNIALASPHVASKQVRFRSDVPIEELRELYRTCALLVLPLQQAKMSSGQTVLLENLAVGTPILATDVPCLSDYVTSSGVRLVPEGDVASMRRGILTGPPQGATLQDFPFDAMATAQALKRLILQTVQRTRP